MTKYLRSHHLLLALILLLACLLRLYRLDFPNTYVFDEVYHAFTAKEFLLGHIQAWEWWNTPPPGVAYEWTHPPLAKELMALSMFLFNTQDPWAWRLPGVILGVVSIYLLYLVTLRLFQKENLALLVAFLFSLDGLTLVQSRTGMNDIYLITFTLFCLLLFLRKQFVLSAIFLGFALSSKWTALYFVPIPVFFLIKHRQFKYLPLFVCFPLAIYLFSYLPFFTWGHSFNQFIELQKQIWYYHSHLKATHDYSSPWWSWPLNLYPVWYYVERQNNLIANIFASGNPFLYWAGLMAVIFNLIDFVRKRSEGLLLILIGYLIFWLPWSLSPRIMFLYHYSPSVPFLAINLGYQLNRLFASRDDRALLYLVFFLIILGFILIYPMLVGIYLPHQLMLIFFRTNLTKNPF